MTEITITDGLIQICISGRLYKLIMNLKVESTKRDIQTENLIYSHSHDVPYSIFFINQT